MQSNGVIADVFPICDDLTDAEDDDDVFAPSTPVRSTRSNTSWQQSTVYDDGPRTAPITTPRSGFPFNSKTVSTVTPETHSRLHLTLPVGTKPRIVFQPVVALLRQPQPAKKTFGLAPSSRTRPVLTFYLFRPSRRRLRCSRRRSI
ncbi:hypothetical protein EI94DRAFT_1233675 [Lactarius quietus]|nr:hypothetical protein EI94DRAFT_1233675 [Lactarius quietus]